MTLPAKATTAPLCAREVDPSEHDHLLVETLIDRLPDRMRAPTRWLRRPSSRWARIPAAVLLVFGGLLSILPLLGLWMLPLGLLLLAEDVPPLRRTRGRILAGIQRRRPHWFASGEAAPSTDSASQSDTSARCGNRADERRSGVG